LTPTDIEQARLIIHHKRCATRREVEHPEILESLTQALDEVLTGTLGNAVGALENVLGDLDVGGTVDEVLKGRLEEVRDNLQEVLSQAGGKVQGAGGGAGPALPEGQSSSAGGQPSGASPKEE